MRVCVEGVGIVESAVGTGLFGFPGVPTDLPVVLSVHSFDEDGQTRSGGVGPLSLDALGLHEATWRSCGPNDDCALCQTPGEREDGGLLVAVRLL